MKKKYEEKIHDYPILLERVRALEKMMRVYYRVDQSFNSNFQEYNPSTNNLALSIVHPSSNNVSAAEFDNPPATKKYNFEVDYNKQQIRSEVFHFLG